MRGRAANVRFYDDMDTPPRLHRVHQSLRDVSSDQLRLEDDLNREIHRRNRSGQSLDTYITYSSEWRRISGDQSSDK